ncbi:hypothetical protein K432DRAFT_315626, partial [Lepidopterella palustris CBS 459.81]
RLEKCRQHVVPPWWIPPPTHIAESKETAIKEYNTIEKGALCIYTNASAINGYMGAAAIVLDRIH